MEPSGSSTSSATNFLQENTSKCVKLPYDISKTPRRERKPKCEVDLVAFQPRRPPRKKSWFSSSKVDSSDAQWHPSKHWMVLCTMEDGQAFLLDAVGKDGVLIGRMQRHENIEPVEKISLGVHQLDFNDISAAYQAVSIPGKYSKLGNNCQLWVVDLLRTLNVLPLQVETIAQLITRIRQ